MAVHQVGRVIFIQQLHQSLKAPVSRIFRVPQSCRWGVGDHDIHAAQPLQLPGELLNPAMHFSLGVLMGAGVIPAAAPQSQNADAVVDHDVVIDAVAALRGVPVIACVVIAVDIQHRALCHGDKKAQIAGLQISAGQNQVVAAEPARGVVIPEGRAFLIGDGQYLHGSGPPFPAGWNPGKCPAGVPSAGRREEYPQRAGWSRRCCCKASPYAAPRWE